MNGVKWEMLVKHVLCFVAVLCSLLVMEVSF